MHAHECDSLLIFLTNSSFPLKGLMFFNMSFSFVLILCTNKSYEVWEYVKNKLYVSRNKMFIHVCCVKCIN